MSEEVVAVWYYGHGDMGWGSWVAMTLTFILFWGAVVTLVVWAVRSVRRNDAQSKGVTPPPSTTDRADEVLAERFARGEIDEDEFIRRRNVLHVGMPKSRNQVIPLSDDSPAPAGSGDRGERR
jgi:putative membrane protein